MKVNSTIENYIERSCKVEFLHHFQRALTYARYNEVKAEYKSMHTDLVLVTSLKSIERSASCVYTRKAFWLFRSEITDVSSCYVVDKGQRISSRI